MFTLFIYGIPSLKNRLATSYPKRKHYMVVAIRPAKVIPSFLLSQSSCEGIPSGEASQENLHSGALPVKILRWYW